MVFAIEDEMPVLVAEARLFKPYDKIIRRDKGSKGDMEGRRKQLAKRELAYVYWMVSHKSPYRMNYGDEKVRSGLVTEALGIHDIAPRWEPDEVVKEAMAMYGEQIKTPSLAAVQNTAKALNTTVQLIEIVSRRITDDISVAEESGWAMELVQKGSQTVVVDPLEKLVNRISALLKLSKELQLAIDKLSDTETKVKQEFTRKQTMVGGSEKSMFEDDDPY